MMNCLEKLTAYLGLNFKNEWKYIGNDTSGYDYFLLCKRDLHIEQPVKKCQCICGVEIKYNYYIYNIITKKVEIVGSECYKRFIPYGKTCMNCNALHNNRITNKCNRCRINYKNCKQCNNECLKTLLHNGRCNICRQCIICDEIHINKGDYCNECVIKKNTKECNNCTNRVSFDQPYCKKCSLLFKQNNKQKRHRRWKSFIRYN